jgi:hypothetical protein
MRPAESPAARPPIGAWAALAGMLVLAVAVRLVVLPLPGHGGDVLVMARWAENLAAFQPWHFYEHDGSIYPSLLPALWLLGVAFDGGTLSTAIKGLSIPFDLAIGVVLFVLLAGRTRSRAGLLAAGLYLFNPALLLAGPVWGQVDAAGTLFFLGALLALAADRSAAAGALAVLAGLAKPQFGLVALPVLVVAGQRRWRDGAWGPLGRTLAGGAVAAVVIGLLLGLGPDRWQRQLFDTATFQPQTSLNAINLWGMVVGMEIDDAPYVGIGAVLLAVGLVGALRPLRRGHDLATVLAVGMILAFAFYFLPTRVHERYLFPALAVAAPFAAVYGSALAAYLSLSVGFAATLARALVLTTSFRLPADLEALLTADWMVWVIGLVLIGSALTLVRLALTGAGAALRGPPEPDHPAGTRPADGNGPAGASAAPG